MQPYAMPAHSEDASEHGEAVSQEPSNAMDDQELIALLQAHENQAVGYYTSEIANEQAKALDYYYGRPFGDEQTGRSQVVDRTVAIVVDNATAAILRPFVTADDAVQFEPRGPEDEQTAEQATEYVNYVFQVDNNGFILMHNWCKAGLLEKIGITKTWWEDYKTTSVERMSGLDASQIEDLMHGQGEDYQIIGGPYTDEDGLYAVDVRHETKDGKVKICTVPSEELLIEAYAREMDDIGYIAHRPRNVTRSDLVEMGFDAELVESLPAAQSGTFYDPRTMSRLQDESFASVRGNMGQGAGNDPSRDLVALLDEYVLVDYDGDGVAERRRILRVGHDILLNEEVEDHPFAIWCPVPMPHKVYGLSLADQTLDLQRISSVLWRQTLDNLYLANNPKIEVPLAAATADGATYDDLQDPAPGGIIRTQQAGMLRPFEIPFVADKSFPMLEFVQAQQEARTGISRAGQGLDENALKKSGQMTATEMAMIADGKNVRAEMIARIFAETGMKRLFKIILKLLVNHQPRERVIRLRNQWVSIDPRSWNAEMDVAINVGLGVGTKAEQAAQATDIAQTIAEVVQSPFAYLIGPEEAYHTVKRKLNAAGVKDVENYMKDPAQTQPPPPQPSPEMAKVQANAQAQQMQMQSDQQMQQAQMQLDQQKFAAELQQAQTEGALKLQLMHEEAAAKLELARQKAQAEQDLAIRQQDFEMEMARQDMALKAAQAEHQANLNEQVAKMRPGGALDE